MTELERINRELVEASRRLANAEERFDYETVLTETAEIDQLLDRQNRLQRTMIETTHAG